MSIYEIIFLALILATDAFIVSFSYGICKIKNVKKSALLLALGTGFFQFLMPLIGAFFTNLIFNLIQTYSKYLAGTIFIIIGIKMLFESKSEDEQYCTKDVITEISLKTVFIISIATSIDALAAGSSLFLMQVPVFTASVLIGIITFILSLTGFFTGKYFKKIAPEIICKFAGAILILLGLKSIFL